MKKGRVRTIFFDVGWTLIHPKVSLWETFSSICGEARRELSALECERIVWQAWAERQKRAMENFDGGARYADSDEKFIRLFLRMGEYVFTHAGISEGQPELVQKFLRTTGSSQNWQVFPDVVETLRIFKEEGYILGILSNAASTLPRFLESLGISSFFDFLVISAVEGVKKPDRRIFQRALELARVSPEEALHVGDLYMEDVLGARHAGIRPILMDRRDRAIFPHFPPVGVSPTPGVATISNLTELPALLLM